MPTQIFTELKLPAGVGPHEGREYRLMAAGQKKVALFSDFIPLDFVLNPAQMKLSHLCDERGLKTIFHLPDGRADAHELLTLTMTPQFGLNEEIEKRIGQILGYEKIEIEAYLSHLRRILVPTDKRQQNAVDAKRSSAA